VQTPGNSDVKMSLTKGLKQLSLEQEPGNSVAKIPLVS